MEYYSRTNDSANYSGMTDAYDKNPIGGPQYLRAWTYDTATKEESTGVQKHVMNLSAADATRKNHMNFAASLSQMKPHAALQELAKKGVMPDPGNGGNVFNAANDLFRQQNLEKIKDLVAVPVSNYAPPTGYTSVMQAHFNNDQDHITPQMAFKAMMSRKGSEPFASAGYRAMPGVNRR